MTDDADTIEIDWEELANFIHMRYMWITEFYPAEEFAEVVSQGGDETRGSYDEELGYANGNIAGESTVLHDARALFDIDPRELAEEYAEEQDYDTFEKPPFDDDDMTMTMTMRHHSLLRDFTRYLALILLGVGTGLAFQAGQTLVTALIVISVFLVIISGNL